MMLHLSLSVSVPVAQVVALVDLSRDPAGDTKALMARLAAAGRLKTLGEPAKTLVLLGRDADIQGLLSPISARTLSRRAGENYNEDR